MATYIFNGECQQSIKQAFIDTYLQKLKLVVETTADYKKSGIYSAYRYNTNIPIVIDWGDGTVERIDGENIFQKVHEYATVSTFNVIIKNIRSYTPSYYDTWWRTTSQNKYTLKEVVSIPDSVTGIGSLAFFDCSAMTSITIPNSVTHISDQAFKSSGLTSVTMSNVMSIKNNAFEGCSNLTSVTIGNGVTSIGGGAFKYCSSLTSVIFEGKTLAEVQAMSNYPWGITDTSIITVI